MHLNAIDQYLGEVVIIPSGLKLLGVNTAFGSFLLFEQIERHVSQNSHVFGSVIFMNTIVVFIHCNIQNPMEFIFNGPMSANNM